MSAQTEFYERIQEQLRQIEAQGLYKHERVIASQQSALIEVAGGEPVLNFCANNYLGLANHPDLISAACEATSHYGFGMASVRFICGTQAMHKNLESKLATFLGTEDAILYTSCFDANGGLFETLLDEHDAVISDALNHASIIDGVRLCKAARYRYANNDMVDLEAQLQAANMAGVRTKLIATDGVFSMDGVIANLQGVCDLAERYGALVMVDDSHAVGFVGATGRGTHELCRVMDRGRYHHRHPGQSTRWCLRWLHCGPTGGGRSAAPAFSTLSLLQFRAAGNRRRQSQGVGHAAGRR